MNCPINHTIRPDAPPLPPFMQHLPIDERGYVVPFFVAWPNGKPDFRMADPRKKHLCETKGLCWVCGKSLGRLKSFTIGPMCAVNRTTAEPPEHLECAEWSVKGCPFLSKPKMERRSHDDIKGKDTCPGIMIERNPGATCIWTTKAFNYFSDHMGGKLIHLGDPVSVTWWREGRPATRAEVLESIETGLPLLKKYCSTPDDFKALAEHVELMQKYLPV